MKMIKFQTDVFADSFSDKVSTLVTFINKMRDW